jgi:hypothetical protein
MDEPAEREMHHAAHRELLVQMQINRGNATAGGSGANVPEFLNQGGGLYDIRIVPFIDNPACAWLSGEYVYGIQLEFTHTIGGETVVLQGGTLGKLAIP